MDFISVIGALAAMAAFLAGVFCAQRLLSARIGRTSKTVLGQEGVRTGWTARCLRAGFAPFKAPARFLLKCWRINRVVTQMVVFCNEKSYATLPDALLSALMAVMFAMAVIAGALSGSLIAAITAPACGLALIAMVVKSRYEARQNAIQEAIPDILRSMELCFQTGYTLMQTFEQIAKEFSGPLHTAFSQAASLLETGRPASEALASLKESSAIPELSFVAVAMQVQHDAGGSMKQVLEAARDTVEGELELKRALRVHTAQAKLSARIVSVMPLVLIALFSLISEGFLEPFFTSFTGMALLILAIAMQVTGILLVRRMLAVEITL